MQTLDRPAARHSDPMPSLDAPLRVSPCGCTFKGRFYSQSDCAVLDLTTATGRQQVAHMRGAIGKATPVN